MDYKVNFERYEIKYLLSLRQYNRLLAVMKNHLKLDAYGKSTIINIYYDTPNGQLIRQSNEKPIYKEKLRVRSYGVANISGDVFIELKKKYNGVVYKRRMAMNYAEALKILVNQEFSEESQIAKEINYFFKYYKNLQPAMYLAYEREAYFGIEDEDFRMTFDHNIVYRVKDLNLSSQVYGEALLDSETVLLEVKTALGIPDWLVSFLTEENIYKTTFSKYGEAYKKATCLKIKGGVNHVA